MKDWRDSAYPPTNAQLALFRAQGVSGYAGYFKFGNDGILNGWSNSDFQRVQYAGLKTLAYCSGYADPVVCANRAAGLGIQICLDDESGMRADGPWVQGWLDRSGAGLYGNGFVHSGRKALFHVLAAYPGGDPKATWGIAYVAKPAGPCGWQWRGSHNENGITVDSAWFDDAIGGVFGAGSNQLGEDMDTAQYYRLLSAVYGVMLGPDGAVQKDAAGKPIPTEAVKTTLNAVAAIPGAKAVDLSHLEAVEAKIAADVAAIKAKIDKDLA